MTHRDTLHAMNIGTDWSKVKTTAGYRCDACFYFD
jgi:hypothetical protein